MDQFQGLVDVMERLLAPQGCPWDREQTPQTLRAYVLEEAYEVVDAIDRGDPEDLQEELGDLMLQVVFLSALARREGWFDVQDVAEGISSKLIRRHPHVFGDAPRAGDGAQALSSWEAVKAEERKDSGRKPGAGVLDGVPRAMPALLRATRVVEKAQAVGVQPETPAIPGWDALQEQLPSQQIGNLLFALAAWSAGQGVDPEAALRESIDRFSDDVSAAENKADPTP